MPHARDAPLGTLCPRSDPPHGTRGGRWAWRPTARGFPDAEKPRLKRLGTKGRGLRITGIVTASVGVFGLIVGGILWQEALDENSEAVNQLQSNPSQAHSTRIDAEGLSAGSNVCLIAGGVLNGLGLITTLLSFVDDTPSKGAALAPALGTNFAGATVKGVW